MRRWLFAFSVALHICVGTAAWAQEAAPVFRLSVDTGGTPAPSEYTREWLVLGPFVPDDLEMDFLAHLGGEANIEPREGGTVTTAEGTVLKWKRYKSETDIINLLDAVEGKENAIAYAFCVLKSEVASDARLHLGSDNGITVWINGEQAYHNPIARQLFLDEDMFEARLKANINRFMVKVSQGISDCGFAVQVGLLPPNRAVLSGVVTSEVGDSISGAEVRLERDGEEIARTQTGPSGSYSLDVHPVRGLYDLYATRQELGSLRSGIRLGESERRTLNLTLKEAVSIEGTLLMLDDATPHVAVPVQAIHSGKVVATKLSDDGGRYRLVNLRAGRYQVRCQVLGGYVYYGEEKAGEPESRKAGGSGNRTMSGELISLRIEQGETLKDIDFRFAPFKKGTWKNYDMLDGLAHNAVSAIYRDPDGMIWFATEGGGVSRYDGKGFTNLTTKDGLAHDHVCAIYRDPDGVMWFGTHGGVSRYDGKGFVNLTTRDGLISDVLEDMYCDPAGVIWSAGWGRGVSRYDGKTFVNFTRKDGLANHQIWSLHGGPDGVIWIGTRGGGVYRYDDRGTGDFRHFVNFTTKDGLARNDIWCIYCDADGVAWFGTHGGGVSRYDGKEFVNFTEKDGLLSNSITSIYRGPDGVIWFGTARGVSRYDGTFVNFTVEDGLASNRVGAIHRDPDGVMWFGTGGTDTHQQGGVSRYDEGELVNFTEKDGLVDNRVWTIHGDPDGVMWFGTRGGVSRYDGNEFVNLTTKDGLASSNVRAIHHASDGVMWFGMRWGGGVSRYDGKEFVNFTTKDGLAGNDVLAIHCDPDGVMWFGTDMGVSRYDGKGFVNLRETDGLVSNFVSAIHTDPDGVMWFGTRWGGVSRYDGREFVNFRRRDGLADNYVSDIHGGPDGVLWFATEYGGVSRYDGKGFVSLTTEDGLAHNMVQTIHRDSDGNMWFGTNGGGVSCYDGTAWSSLDTRDGLAGNSVASIHQDSDGYLWFATDGGVTRYRRNTVPPKVRIASVTTDQTYRLKSQDSRPKTEDSRLKTEVPSIPAFTTGTRVTIEYYALDSRTVPEKVQYRHRIYETRDTGLKTQDSLESREAYSPPTRETNFDWLPRKPGRYTFEVQAIERDLNYSEPASLQITILPPPIYTRAGFIAGSISAAFLIPTIIYALLLIRQKRGQVFETIPNPYIVGNPIRSKDMFFGREDDFQFIHDKLVGSPTGLIIVLAGERRSGKTSILYQILNGRLGERFVPVFVDMQAMTVRDDAEFFGQMAQETAQAIQKSPLNSLYKKGEIRHLVESYDFRAEAHPALTFQRYVDDLMPAIEDRMLLFLIDEYELLEAKVEDGTLSGDSITFFAGLMERHPRVAFLFTGSRHLEERTAPFWQVLLAKSIARYVSFLSERDTERLVREPVRGRVQYARGVPEAVYRLTAGQPFYTQVVCQNLIDRLNVEERSVAGQNDVIAVAREIEENPLPQMLYFWDSFAQEQQWALSMLAELQEQPDQAIQITDILRAVKEYELPIPLSEADWRRALESLCRREIVQRVSDRGEYRFRIDVFRPWVRHQHSIWEAQG